MMFRAGPEAAEYANMILEIKNEDNERLVGNPNKSTSILIPGSMVDATGIVTMSNAGALEEILTMLSRGNRPGVIREFKSEMNSFLSSAKWLLFGAKPQYRPKNMHEDLAPFNAWSEMIEMQKEDPEPAISKLLNIIDKTKERLEAQNREADNKAVFRELERAVSNSRIVGIKGFYKAADGAYGTEGEVGNYISYKIVDGNIRLFTTGDLKPWDPKLRDPDNGVKNNVDAIKSLGYKVDANATWDWVLPVEGDVSKQLDELVDALSGADVDAAVITAHRAKGLEFTNVKIGSDWTKPNEKRDAESAAAGMLPKILTVEYLNAAYVALTRAMDSLDPNSLDWFDGIVEELKERRKEGLRAVEAAKARKAKESPKMGPDSSREGPAYASDPGNVYDYLAGWSSEFLGGPNGDSYRHSWSSPDGQFEVSVLSSTKDVDGVRYQNDDISISQNGRELFKTSNDTSLDGSFKEGSLPEDTLDKIAQELNPIAEQTAMDSISEGRYNQEMGYEPISRDYTYPGGLAGMPESPVEGMTQEELDQAYEELAQQEYDYQMSLEPISRDFRFPGGKAGLLEMAVYGAVERMAAQLASPVVEKIAPEFDFNEYVKQLQDSLPTKDISLIPHADGTYSVQIAEKVNKAGLLGAYENFEAFSGPDSSAEGPDNETPAPGDPGSDEDPVVLDGGSTKNNARNQNVADEVVKKILEAMEKGIIPWKKPWEGGGSWLPTSGATGKNYKGRNLLLLLLASQENNYKGTRWYTKNAVAKLGGYVDDADGQMITKVVKFKYKVKDDNNASSPAPAEAPNGEQPEKTKERTGARLDFDVVYNEDVIKGITLAPIVRKPAPEPHEVEQILLDAYTDHPKIFHSASDEAYWDPNSDEIHLPLRAQFDSQEEFLDTLFHELTHSTGHGSRLDRKDLLENYGTHKSVRAREELIAEIGSAILASMLGVNTSIDNVAAYVQSWKRFLQDEPNALHEAASMASKAVEHILKGWNSEEEGLIDSETDENSAVREQEAQSMPIGPISGEDGTSGGLGSGVNYRIEGNRIFLMGNTLAAKDKIKGLSLIPTGGTRPFSFFWDRKANNWSVSLKTPEDRIKILEQLKSQLA
jgi:antirestriction protein ArdC